MHLLYLIQQDIRYLESKNDPFFKKHLAVIKETNYKLKFRFELFPNSSTTWGRRYVRITQDYLTWTNQKGRAAHLIHEATHCMQYERLGGTFQFLSHYIFGGMNDLEAEARGFENRFLTSY